MDETPPVGVRVDIGPGVLVQDGEGVVRPRLPGQQVQPPAAVAPRVPGHEVGNLIEVGPDRPKQGDRRAQLDGEGLGKLDVPLLVAFPQPARDVCGDVRQAGAADRQERVAGMLQQRARVAIGEQCVHSLPIAADVSSAQLTQVAPREGARRDGFGHAAPCHRRAQSVEAPGGAVGDAGIGRTAA